MTDLVKATIELLWNSTWHTWIKSRIVDSLKEHNILFFSLLKERKHFSSSDVKTGHTYFLLITENVERKPCFHLLHISEKTNLLIAFPFCPYNF